MNKKIAWSTAILAVCLGVSIYANRSTFNAMLANNAGGVDSRSPASQIIQSLKSGALVLQSRLADRLARSPAATDRSPSNVGHSATPLEALKFGILQGKYAVQMKDNHIEAITFVPNPKTDSTPSTISDRIDFLKRYGTLFGMKTEFHAKRVNVAIRGERIIETYEIKASRSVASDKGSDASTAATNVTAENKSADSVVAADSSKTAKPGAEGSEAPSSKDQTINSQKANGSGSQIVRFELDDLDRLFSIQTEQGKHLEIF